LGVTDIDEMLQILALARQSPTNGKSSHLSEHMLSPEVEVKIEKLPASLFSVFLGILSELSGLSLYTQYIQVTSDYSRPWMIHTQYFLISSQRPHVHLLRLRQLALVGVE
jgi:hypothetical protein